MRLRGPVAFAVLALSSATGATGQAPAGLSGRVIDATTNVPLDLVDLQVDDQRRVSDQDGGFRFASVSAGTRALSVRRIGYSPLNLRVDLVPGMDQTLEVRLTPLAIRLDTITITAQTPGTTTISGADLARRGSDLGSALDGWEGVSVRRNSSSGPAAPQVQGGGPEEVLVLVDGFPLNDPLTGRADLSRISSRDVERVTLLPGAHPAPSGGRAITGVLIIDTRSKLPALVSTWVSSYTALGGRAGLSRDNFSLSLTGERYAEDFPYDVPAVRGGGEGTRVNVGGYGWSANARYDGPVDVTFRGTAASHGIPGVVTNPTPSAHAQDGAVFLGARTGRRWEVSGALQWLDTRVSDSAPPVGTPYDERTHGLSTIAGLTRHGSVHLGEWTGGLAVGIDGRYDQFGGDGVRSGAEFYQAGGGAQLSLEKAGPSTWTLASVLRLDSWRDHSVPAVTARIDGGWSRNGTSLSLSAGSALATPVLSDLFFREGVGVRINPDLRPERTLWEIAASLRRTWVVGHMGVMGSARLFYGRVVDMVLWAPGYQFIWSPMNFNVRRRGGELSLGISPAATVHLEAGAAYNAVSYDVPDGAQVRYRPQVTSQVALSWAPRRWQADVRWHLIGSRFPNSAGTNPLPPINLIDLGIERSLGSALVLRGGVHDLLDERAEFIAGYPVPGRTFTLTLDLTIQ